MRELPPEPPRLCSAGPCRRYHQFKIQLDAQNPMDERKSDGTVTRHGRVFHVQTHHYCYPDVGIETNLGALPVLECSKWVPITGLLRTKRGIRRRFDRELADWHSGQAPADVGHASAEDAAESTFGKNPITLHVVIGIGDLKDGASAIVGPIEVVVFRGWAMREVAAMACKDVSIELDRSTRVTVEIVASLEPADIINGYREPIDNEDATVEQLELSDGDKLLVTLK